MSRVLRRAWDDDSKLRAVNEVAARMAEGEPVKEACRNAGIADGLFYRWRKEFGEPVAVTPPLALNPSIKIASISADELTRLKAENAKMRKFIGEAMVDMFLRGEMQMSVKGKDDASHG